jgi:uncharacterized membrane protein YecN with MAPEG domain
MNQTALAAAGLYAGLCTFILLWLTVATGRLRRRYRVLIGDGDNAHLIRIMRGHANAVENIPITLILFIAAALLGAPAAAIHVLGIAFVVARAIHAWHFIDEHGAKWQRMAGFGVGMLVTVVAAAGVIGHALFMLV